ncbi:dihydromonapterin reductase [Salinimonas lutimaris]|uniref:dihydromonapterin reductase n=1 Tax=Salinimonas lutimaris TaxID=914153 RepID=UPI0010BFA5F2|nr:dihydromonapterin reductase [Salinimonas lutimaris]
MRAPVLITGATQRIGLSLAEHFMARDIPVIVTYRRPKSALTRLQQAGATTLQADFATNEGISALISAVKDHTSALRAIIHNASDWDKEQDNQDPAALMAKMMQVHVSAPYQINLGLQTLLGHQGLSDIIHMTDFVTRTGHPRQIAYAASKAALDNMTLSFATLLADQAKVNSIAPALLMFTANDDASSRQKAQHKQLLAPAPGPQEAVSTVEYIMNSDYITGRTLHLDGGRHLV